MLFGNGTACSPMLNKHSMVRSPQNQGVEGPRLKEHLVFAAVTVVIHSAQTGDTASFVGVQLRILLSRLGLSWVKEPALCMMPLVSSR